MHTTDEIITLVGHSRSVRCLHVDGTNEVRLVSGSNDRSIKVRKRSIHKKVSMSGSCAGLEHIYQSNLVEMRV